MIIKIGTRYLQEVEVTAKCVSYILGSDPKELNIGIEVVKEILDKMNCKRMTKQSIEVIWW